MTIYRIQDHEGRGPWKPGFSDKWVRPKPDQSLVPWAFEMSGEVVAMAQAAPNWGCGCTSIEQLKRWFTKQEYRTLKRFGYKSVKISGAVVIGQSEIQAVFCHDRPLKEAGRAFKLY